MPEYTDPATVEPFRAGTARVGSRKQRERVVLADPDDTMFRWLVVPGMSWHTDAHLADLVLDVPAGEAPADSIVLTLDEIAHTKNPIHADGMSAMALFIGGYQSSAGYLLGLIADKLDALPKPVPLEPKGQVVAFVDERFWHPTGDGGWLPVEGPDEDAPTWPDLVEIARKEDRRDHSDLAALTSGEQS